MLAAIVESTEDAILGMDRNGLILAWNSGAERLYGYTEAEIIGKNISILIPPDQQGEEKTILDRIIAGERITHYETNWMKKNGEQVLASLTISPVRDAAGIVVGASAIARDLTEIRLKESLEARTELLEAKREQALELNDAVVQGLVLAKLSLETGDSEGALHAVERSLAAARRIIGELIEDAHAKDGRSLFLRDTPPWNMRGDT